MGRCSTCKNWSPSNRTRSRGRCDEREHLGYGKHTSATFGQKCDKHERLTRPPRDPPRHKTRLELSNELTATRGELVRWQSRARRRLQGRSRDWLLEAAGELTLADLQWLRGELAMLVARKVSGGGS